MSKKEKKAFDDVSVKAAKKAQGSAKYVVVSNTDDSTSHVFATDLNGAMDALGEFEAGGYDAVVYTTHGLAMADLLNLVEVNICQFIDADKKTEYGKIVDDLMTKVPDDVRLFLTDDDRIDAIAHAIYCVEQINEKDAENGTEENEDEDDDDAEVTITIGKKSLGVIASLLEKFLEMKKNEQKD